MSGSELPLFSWRPPCKVIAFPLNNRVGKVRKTASILSKKHGEDADLYWKQIVAGNRKHLLRIGLSEAAIDAELLSFHQAVHAEMVRQAYRGSTGTPGGAA
ncbi:DUF6074 family protein [Rhizobium sp. GR12]|uniref:DUF6074 family protein n=1 Tax=Rhizobium sp. GR12 TaxID=3053925 RepID=UPI002FBDAEFC